MLGRFLGFPVTGFLILGAVSIASASAPFCVATASSKQCYYYDVETCNTQAKMMNGICVPNTSSAPSPSQPLPSSFGGDSRQPLPSDIYGNAYNAIVSQPQANRLMREQEEALRQQQQIQNQNIMHNEVRLILELKEKSTRFSKEFPGEPNPYQQALSAMKENYEKQAEQEKIQEIVVGTVLGIGLIGLLIFAL